MPYTEFCCRSGGSNLNAGTRKGDGTEPGTSPDFTYASGSWVASTGVFTVASGNPVTDGVAVNDYASIYADGASAAAMVGVVTARTSTTITISTTQRFGTAPTDGTNNRTVRIGGAWRGPNGTDGFPLNTAQALLPVAGVPGVRINLKNDQTYSVTAAITVNQSTLGTFAIQGYSTTYGDGGRATIDGGTSGASYTLVTFGGTRVYCQVDSIIFQNNGATGSATLVNVPNGGFAGSLLFRRCVFANSRGHGVVGFRFIECEAYNNNLSGTANLYGFMTTVGGCTFVRCISHDNNGASGGGFGSSNGGPLNLINCISESNAGHGVFMDTNDHTMNFFGCDFYNNGGSGILAPNALRGPSIVESCNFVKNGGYAFSNAGNTAIQQVALWNCGFGSGTQANAAGKFLGTIDSVNEVTYASGVTPWADPVNGDFRITLAAAKAAGRGAWLQTAASYGGTISYPDIGAAQSQGSGGGASGFSLSRLINLGG